MYTNNQMKEAKKLPLVGFNHVVKIKFFLLAIAYVFTITDSLAQSLLIVKNNRPNACIVIDSVATDQVKGVAKTLQEYIFKSTGALLPIRNSANSTISIYLGLSPYVKQMNIDLSKLDEDGFILQGIDANKFIIVGGTDWGTEYGVYEFLERYVGVYWLMPTDAGTVIPKHNDILVLETKILQNPVYLSREVSPVNINSKNFLGVWGRLNRTRGRISFHHNLLNLFPPHQFAKTNPEFYPTINGKRHVPINDSDIDWQPNFSAPGIADSAAQKVINYFKENPDVASYSLAINDNRNFDQSAQSVKRRSGRKNFLGDIDVSDEYFLWVNKVVDKVRPSFPEKKFGLLAFLNVAEPPIELTLNLNVIPFITYERLRWSDLKLQKDGKELTERWSKHAREIGWYDYAYGYTYLVPRVWFHNMQKYLLWGSKHQVKYYYAELYPNWGEGPKAWILTKLLWNPSQNVDSLLNIWYNKAAGKAAAPYLKKFYSIWENFWTVDINHSSKWNTKSGQYLPFNDINYLAAVPLVYINTADKLLNKAYFLVDNPKRKVLVGKLKQMWNLYKLCMITYNNKDGGATEKKIERRLKIISRLKADPLFSNTIDWIVTGSENITNRNWGKVIK
jgi:hypothetical protein